MIPSVPITKQMVMKDGNVHPSWGLFFNQLIQVLQNNITPEGNVIPAQSATNIALLNNSKSNNKLLINSDANTLLVNLNGVFKTVTTS
jgi:hypothetical protein